MATQWISPTWRMPKNSNQSKVDNYSLDFDGTAEYITVGQISEINSASAVTISYWAKKEAASGDDMAVGSLVTSTNGIWLQWYTDNNVYFSPRNGGTTNVNTSLTGDTNWHHLVGVYDGTNMTIYIDGAQAVTSTTSVPAALSATAGDNFQIGALNGGYFTSGQINQVTVYEQALTSDQVAALYNSGTPVNPMALTPLPIAYYPIGDTATGSSTTLTVPNDAVPSATVFNFVESSTQYIDIGTNNSVLMPTDELSISLWVKFSAAAIGNYRGLFTANSTGGNDGYLIWKSNTNLLQFYIRESGVWRTASFSPAVVQDVWYHVVGTWDGTDVKIYVDNVVGGTTATASSITYNASTVNRIGDYATYEMDGDMANVQFWNKGLSAANVTTLYNNGVPLYTGTQPETANLKGWWKMNVDTSTWDGSNWAIGNSLANYTTALNFPGGTDYIDCTNGFPTTLGASATAVTASGWVKITDLAQQQCLFNITTPGGNYYGDFSIWYHSSSNQLQGYIDSNSNNIKLNSGITDNKWHHLALVYDQSAGATITDGLKLYLDGSLVTPTSSAGSTPASVDFTASGGMTTRLGWGWSNTYTAVAEMSNWAMWNSALTAGNITTLYNDGTPETTISLSPTSYYKLDNTTTGIQDSGSASNNGTITGSVTQVDSFVSTLTGLSDGMTTANLVTSDLTRSIPYSSYSMQFDATNDYVIVPANVLTNFTTSVWLNRDGNGNYDGILGQNTTSAKGGILRYVALQDDDIYVYLDAWYTVATTLALNTWVHFCLTYDSTADELKSYINGILDTTIASPDFSGASTDAHSFTRIGLRNGTDATSFPGKLSNVSLFNSALSQDQILTIYNGGVPNDISSLSPVSWWSLGGDSYYNGTDWICPDLGSAGNNGTSANMSGTEIIGDGPGSTANGVATSMDIPVNLKGDAPNSTSNAFSINMTEIDRVTSVPG
tara:strand:+ start:590 stop:3442 length:2853 start_codon:yes stop_codon:yes gene_type:complete